MKEDFTQKQIVASYAGQPPWDLDQMVDQIRLSVNEEVDPLTIRLTLVDILSSYEDAPIQTFVPILACREAQEALKKKPGIRL